MQTIRELRGIRIPGRADPAVDEVFATVDRTESRLQTELARVAERNRLTPDAERREGLKREGKLVTPKKTKR